MINSGLVGGYSELEYGITAGILMFTSWDNLCILLKVLIVKAVVNLNVIHGVFRYVSHDNIHEINTGKCPIQT